MNKCLALFQTFPKIVDNKVIVIYKNTGYPIRISPLLNIKDNFDPMEYSIENTPEYGRTIVLSTVEEREHVAKVQYWKKRLSLRIGDKIHVRFRRGTYTIVDFNLGKPVISCKKWIAEGTPARMIYISDFVGFAGDSKTTRAVRR